jgi:predicted TIM-barrel fold metal-dependent hydrolase
MECSMRDFVFSMDAHVIEPKTLWQNNLPESFKARGPRGERKEGYLNIVVDNQIVHRMQLGDGYHGQERHGGPDLGPRMQDMDADGIDAEVIYPTHGGTLYFSKDAELQLALAQVYNDWCIEAFRPRPDRFVATAVLPLLPGHIDMMVAEFRRVADLGYKSVLLPCVPPEGLKYNLPDLDPVWEIAATTKIPVSFHVGTGASPIYERGPGAAVINYVEVGNSAQKVVFQLVCGGALDRFPDLQVVTVEAGASWLAGLCERMDETYQAHQYYVKPKLSMLPSEFVRRQVHCTFQTDRACVMSRSVTGVGALLWAADYPHLEGTFPHSKDVIRGLFEGIDVEPAERQAILGGNAARLFGFEIAQRAGARESAAAQAAA